MNENIEKFIFNIKNGDKKTEEEFYNTYKKKLTKYIKKKYPYNNYTEDDVSEILIKIFENINNFDSKKSKISTWIYNIAKNHMIDKLRKKQPVYGIFTNNKKNELSISYKFDINNSQFIWNEPISFYSTADKEVEYNDSLDHISNCIGKEDFSLLSMKYFDGYSYNEIGNKMNLTEAQISSKVNYTKTKLKKK